MPRIWNRCPKCDSERIGAEYLDILYSIGYRRTYCLDCKFSWFEVYELSRIESEDGDLLNYKGEVIEP